MALTLPRDLDTHGRSVVHARFAVTQCPSDGMQLALVNMSELRGGPAPVRMSRFEIAPAAQSPLDTHEEREMWMFAQGTGMLSYRGHPPVRVAAGDVVEFESNESHTVMNTGSEPLVVFSIWWMPGP
jgi:quercetin dioxygenase-like cupin family protein